MSSSYDITKKVKVTNPSSNVDWFYGGEDGFWESTVAAKIGVPIEVRQKGKTVAVADGNGGVVEYWWKAGITDEDLVFKTGLSSTYITDSTYVCTFVNVDGRTSITIPRTLHKKGVNPVVQCYVNNMLTIMDVSNDGSGNITVAWAKPEDLLDYDVLNVHIITSKRGFVYSGENEGNSFVIPIESHECGEYPLVQVWYGSRLETVLIDVVNNGGNVTVSWGEDVEVSAEKKITAIFTEGSFVGESFRNADGRTELTISKEENGVGDAPIVLCYCGGEVVVAEVTNNEDEIVVGWSNAHAVSAETPLVVVVGSELTAEELGADDLARVAWTGSYSDLKDKPVFVATYTNVNERTYLVIPEAAHKCGKEVTVQCKSNGGFVFADTSVDDNGNVTINWRTASLVSAERPLTVYIFGYKVKSKNIDEKKNDADYNDIDNVPQGDGDEGGSGGEIEPLPPQPEPTPTPPAGHVKAILTVYDFYLGDVVKVAEQYFAVNSTVTISDFDVWDEELSAKYDYDDTVFLVDEENEPVTITLMGKAYAVEYTLFLEHAESTETVYGTLAGGGRYNETVSLNNVVYHDPTTMQDCGIANSVVRKWSLIPENSGEIRSGNLYIMNGEYADSVTVVGYISAE